MRVSGYISVLFVLFSVTLAAGQKTSDLLSLQDKIIGGRTDYFYIDTLTQSNPYSVKGVTEDYPLLLQTTTASFWNAFNHLRDKAIALNKLDGQVNFGFNGSTSGINNVFVVMGNVSIQKGSYPYEFQFNTTVNIQAANGQIQENLSDVQISYDRFIVPNKMWLEGTTFLSRLSDNFLNVDQRYEIGAGLILAKWKKKIKDAEAAELSKFEEDLLKIDPVRNEILICQSKTACNTINTRVALTEDDSTKLVGVQNTLKNGIYKRYSPLRAGVLLSGFLEIENISVTDSVLIQNDMGMTFRQSFVSDFETTSRFRIGIRPTLDARLSRSVRISVRPYLKLPTPWQWRRPVEGVDEIDYRFELPVTLSFNADGNFGMRFNYTWFYDNVPNSFNTGFLDPSGNRAFLIAGDSREMYNMTVTYRFGR